MAFKAVLFDMDGVIVDTEPLHKKAYFQMFEEFGAAVSPELYATFAGASTKKVCQTVIEQFGLQYTPEDLIQVKRGFFKELFYNDSDFDLIPGVRNLIEHYYENGIKLVLASSASRTTIDMVFEKFDLEKYFIGKISGADLQASKPHPEIFLLAAEIAKEPKENCMVIEDSTNGILAAHRAEIFCAGFKSTHTHLQDYSLANIVVSDFQDLEVEKISSYFT
jgi:beta-phosphoglucomutase